MSQFVRPQMSTVGMNASAEVCSAVSNTSSLEEMAHELRQPLSVIESLAYYLEMMSADEGTASHLRRIQAMVVQANRVLVKACGAC